MWVTTLWSEQFIAAQWVAVVVGTLIAAAIDLRSRRIPNWLTAPMWLAGVAFALGRYGTPGMMDGLLASFILAFPYLLLFVLLDGGAGDAKMMAAVGAWLGVVNGLVALVAISLVGVAVAVICTMRHQHVTMTATESFAHQAPTREAGAGETPQDTMPYGVPIFIGAVLSAVGVMLWKA